MAAELSEDASIECLASFLSANGKRPWEWGLVDCTMMVGDWVFQRTGLDPAGPYRGAYSSADECHALIKREGGFMPLVGMRMDDSGFERTQSPKTGDIGIVSAPIALSDRMPVVGAVMAIRFKQWWAVRSMRGVSYRDLSMVTAWSIPA